MKEFMSIKEVAEYLGVDYKTIYRLVQQAEIPAGKVGGVYRIRRQEVEAYFQRQQQAITQEAAKTTQLKCGRCLRLLAPHEISGLCTEVDCDEPLCHDCWEEDPDHRCRIHVLSREARLRQAQAQLEEKKILLLLTSAEARSRELLYLSRAESKLRLQESIPNPLTGRSLRTPNWDTIGTRIEELERFREAAVVYLDELDGGTLPTNPRYTYRLAQGLVLEVLIYSDLATHLKQGFVTQPTTFTELFELLSRAIGRAEDKNDLTILGLAATAGWEKEAIALIQGEGSGQRPFHHRLVAPVLVDLADDRLVFNRTDERLDQLARFFSPEMTMDVVQEIMTTIETLFQSGRTGVLMSEIIERSKASAVEVTKAFERLATTGAYRMEDVDKRDRLLLRRSV